MIAPVKPPTGNPILDVEKRVAGLRRDLGKLFRGLLIGLKDQGLIDQAANLSCSTAWTPPSARKPLTTPLADRYRTPRRLPAVVNRSDQFLSRDNSQHRFVLAVSR